MKKDIHPQYYPQAKIKCACGNTIVAGAIMPEMQIEICSACHPFYTGKGKLIDVLGKVERFRERLARKEELASKRGGRRKKREKRKLSRLAKTAPAANK